MTMDWRREYERSQAALRLTSKYNVMLTLHLDALRLAAKKVLHGEDCAMCDSGKLRNPEKGHFDECGFLSLEQILSQSPPETDAEKLMVLGKAGLKLEESRKRFCSGTNMPTEDEIVALTDAHAAAADGFAPVAERLGW